MSKLDEFKTFIKSNPKFAKNILDKKYTYQQLYETYDMYGENSEVWALLGETSETSFNMKNIINSLKGINPDNLQSNLSTVQKAVSLLEDLTGLRNDSKKEKESKSTKFKDIDRFYSD
ncbi:MAG: spore coat protein YlbD [Bacilli bacterium]